MYDIPLKGLRADQFAAAMATFGLYVVIDDCKIRFATDDGRRYYPILTSEHKDIEKLAVFLTKKATWDRIGLYSAPRWLNSVQVCDTDFVEFYTSHPEIACGFGTDAVLVSPIEKEEKVKVKVKVKKTPVFNVAKTPFLCFKRNTTIGSQVKELQKELDYDGVLGTLSSEHSWGWVGSGQTLGLHPQFETGRIFRNSGKKSKTTKEADPKQRVPILSLLFLASWRMFTVYPASRDVTAMGFNKHDFYYPIFSMSLNQKEFRSLMSNPWLPEFGNYRQGFRHLGVPAVFKTTKQGLTSKEEPHFTDPISL